MIGLEREYDAHTFSGLPILPVERIGRAKAREIMAGIVVRDAQMRLHRFSDQREQMTVIVRDDGARDIGLARMADVRPRTPLEQLFRPLIERGEKFREVASAVENYSHRIVRRYEEASANYAALKEDLRAYEREFVRQNPGHPLPRPQFTAWEIGRIELHAAKEADPALREHYEKLYRESLANLRDDFHHDAFIRSRKDWRH